jgi:uncharacterized protein
MSVVQLTALALLSCTVLAAQPKRVLYITHSAGFVHGSIPVSADVMRSIASASGKLEVTQTEDVSLLNATALRSYDAVFFFTSGELPISDQQKRDLLDFVRSGKGFGGAHSATDTFYAWPEYGDLIGAYFNGHPWVQPAKITIEDPSNPIVAPLSPSWTIQEEFYQFRNLSRERVRVLMRLDTSSVNMKADGVNPNTDDFPLAWIRNYGSGRVFYTALGHFDETWRDERFQKILLQAMLWMTGQIDADATPRPLRAPKLTADAIGNAASFTPRGAVSPGAIISLFGQNLTESATAAADDIRNPVAKLAGTALILNGTSLPLLYASPAQINAYVPLNIPQLTCSGGAFCPKPLATITTPSGSLQLDVDITAFTPGVFVATTSPGYVTFWATGLGPVERRGSLDYTSEEPVITIGNTRARVQFSGLAPGWLGLYQVNAEIPPGAPNPLSVNFQFRGYSYQSTLSGS